MGTATSRHGETDTIRRITKTFNKTDNIAVMAFVSVETKAEALMVKFLSSLNQFVLIHCFVMMLLADFIRADTEADYAFQEGDDDESQLMDRADAVSSLLPCLAVVIMGAVVASGGRRVLSGNEH